MTVKDIKIGGYYRSDFSPNSWFIQVIKILKPKEGINKHNYTIIECSWSSSKDSLVGRIVYQRPKNLIPLTNKD